MTPSTRQRAGQLFASLAHPARLRIVELLCQGEQTVNSIAAEIDLSQSGTSQHLAILTRAGVLVVEPQGAARIYRVRGPRIGRILALIKEFCETHELYGMAEEDREEEDREEEDREKEDMGEEDMGEEGFRAFSIVQNDTLGSAGD